MVREQIRAILLDTGEKVAQPLCRRGVQALALLSQQRIVGRVLHQPVLEDEALLTALVDFPIDQTGVRQRRQRRLQVTRIEIADLADQLA